MTLHGLPETQPRHQGQPLSHTPNRGYDRRYWTSEFITALDLTKGYWQVPVAKAIQEKTAFVTPWGVPVCLVNAPSTFQHLMELLLEGTQTFSVAYLDDVIIHSRCWEEHLEHLREILTRLRKAGLTIKESKCKFTRNEYEYLGHTVGRYTLCRPKYKPYKILPSPLQERRPYILGSMWVLSPFHSRLFDYCNLPDLAG